jgi:hypothetical protein
VVKNCNERKKKLNPLTWGGGPLCKDGNLDLSFLFPASLAWASPRASAGQPTLCHQVGLIPGPTCPWPWLLLLSRIPLIGSQSENENSILLGLSGKGSQVVAAGVSMLLVSDPSWFTSSLRSSLWILFCPLATIYSTPCIILYALLVVTEVASS